MKKLVIKYNKTNVTSSLNMASLLGIKHKVLLALIDRLSPSFKIDRGERYFKLQQNLCAATKIITAYNLFLHNIIFICRIRIKFQPIKSSACCFNKIPPVWSFPKQTNDAELF